ncbi:MAG: sigma-70 family RNA polymerase sigma factor [Bacteroidaceae bacterium]|nr:sigma-70 family RNA polymerase sigma factor [Bacteroidaceae bacterium]
MRHNVQKNEVAALENQLPKRGYQRLSELTDDMRLLVVSHLPLAYAAAWRLRDCGIGLDDLRQEGCLGLCEAAMRYNENVDCTFATYASHWCRKMMFLAIKRHKRGDDSPCDESRHEDDDEDLLRTGQMNRIHDALGCLSLQEQQIIDQYYGLDSERLSITEIADGMGVSKARASTLHRQALQKLEKALMKRPLVDYLGLWLEKG